MDKRCSKVPLLILYLGSAYRLNFAVLMINEEKTGSLRSGWCHEIDLLLVFSPHVGGIE
jgi:hypothetical protein